MVQRDFSFAIVDEVDSILIDEARTPLIISGPAESNSEHYTLANQIVPILVEDDYDLDEKGNSVSLSEVALNTPKLCFVNVMQLAKPHYMIQKMLDYFIT